MAGGNPASCIAEWNGTSWSAVGTGMNGGSGVYTLTVYNGNLIAGGTFTTAGGNPANRVAEWNGTTWSALGSGINNSVRVLDSSNGNLYAGGSFDSAGGNSANHIAEWNGTSWSALGMGVNKDVNFNSLAAYNGDLYAGGSFDSAGGKPANYIARWGTPSGINELLKNNRGVNVYPNPTADNVKVTGMAKGRLKLTELTGRLLLEEDFRDNQTISLLGFTPGTYILHVTDGVNVISKKIVKL